jgi:hypothetical protein
MPNKKEVCQPSRNESQLGKTGSRSKGNERRNKGWPRTPERRNAGQDGKQSRKDDGQDRLQLLKMTACLGKKEPIDLEANPEDIECEAVHEEVPKEEVTVKNARALKKWHGDRHLAVRRCSQLRKWTQDNCGSRKKLAATNRGMIHRAGAAWHKGCRYMTNGQTETMENADQRQCCKGNLEKMNIRKETLGKTRRHPWNKKPRLKTAAMSEEGKDNQ